MNGIRVIGVRILRLRVPGIRLPAALLGVLVALQGGGCTEAHGRDRVALAVSFDARASGKLPAGWRVAETNGRGTPATWKVDGGVLRVTEARNRGRTYNLLLSTVELAADVELRVRLRADTGEEDQGGGLVWRARDAANYYVARWNPLEDNIRAYKVVAGERTQLGSATVTVDPRAWHTIEVAMNGRQMRVQLDGAEVIALEDATFRGAGAVGFWTKADAATSFDDLRARQAQ